MTQWQPSEASLGSSRSPLASWYASLMAMLGFVVNPVFAVAPAHVARAPRFLALGFVKASTGSSRDVGRRRQQRDATILVLNYLLREHSELITAAEIRAATSLPSGTIHPLLNRLDGLGVIKVEDHPTEVWRDPNGGRQRPRQVYQLIDREWAEDVLRAAIPDLVRRPARAPAQAPHTRPRLA